MPRRATAWGADADEWDRKGEVRIEKILSP